MAHLRASDADRERTAQTLRHAAAAGQLTVEELDQRLHDAYRGVTQAELATLTEDLGPLPVPVTPDAAAGKEVDRIISVMSGADRRGRWRVAPRTTVINIMGGSDLDLNDAEFGAPEVRMTVISLMGGSDIRVPEDLDVRVKSTAFMGGNSIRHGTADPRPGGPVLHLRLISIMGGTDVKRGRKKRRRNRHELGH